MLLTGNSATRLGVAANSVTTRTEELYQEFKHPIYTYIYYQVGCNAALAEDLTADVFVKVVRNLERYEERGKPIRAWLYAIARNVVTDHHRSKKRTTWVEVAENLPSAETPIEDAAHLSHQQVQVLQAMGQLTDAQRDVLVMRFIEGRPVQDTAQLMDKQPGAVKTLTRRALASLRRTLAPSAERGTHHE